MTDYHSLRRRAIAKEPRPGEARRAVYEKARTALVKQLRGLDPPLTEAQITRQRLALEEAIRRVEAEASEELVRHATNVLGRAAERGPAETAAPRTPGAARPTGSARP